MDIEQQLDFTHYKKPKIKVCFNKIFSSPYFQLENEKSNNIGSANKEKLAQQRDEQTNKMVQDRYNLIKNQNNTIDRSYSSYLTSDQISDGDSYSKQNLPKQMKYTSSVKHIILNKQNSIEQYKILNHNKADQPILLTRNHQLRSLYETNSITNDSQNKQYTSFNKSPKVLNKQKQEKQIQAYFFPSQQSSKRNIQLNKEQPTQQSFNQSIQENLSPCKESSNQIKKKMFIKKDNLQSLNLQIDKDQSQTNDKGYFVIQKVLSQQNLNINCIDTLQNIQESLEFQHSTNNIQNDYIVLKQEINKHLDTNNKQTQPIKSVESENQMSKCNSPKDKQTQNIPKLYTNNKDDLREQLNQNNAIVNTLYKEELSTQNNENPTGNIEFLSDEQSQKRALKVIKTNKIGVKIQNFMKFNSENPSPTTKMQQKSDSISKLSNFKNKFQNLANQSNSSDMEYMNNKIKQKKKTSDQSQIDNLGIFDQNQQIPEDKNIKHMKILKLSECKLYQGIQIDKLQNGLRSQINQFITSYNISMKQSFQECDKILFFTEYIQNNDSSMLLYPLQSNKTLKDLLISVKLLNEQLIKIIFKDILQGIQQLYQKLKCNLWSSLDFDMIYFDDDYKLKIGQKISSEYTDKDHIYLQKFSLNNQETYKLQQQIQFSRNQEDVIQDFGFLILKSLIGPNYSIFDSNYFSLKQNDNKENNQQQSVKYLRKCCIFHDIKNISEYQINDSFIPLQKANEILKYIQKNVSSDLQNILCGCLRYEKQNRFNFNQVSQYFQSKENPNEQESVNSLQLILKILFSSIHKKEQLQESNEQKQKKTEKLKEIKKYLITSHQILQTNSPEVNFNKLIEKLAFQLSSLYYIPVQEVYSLISQKKLIN